MPSLLQFFRSNRSDTFLRFT